MANYTHKNSKGTLYHLNGRDVTLRGGRIQRIYYFSKAASKEACEMPQGYEVSENKRNGFLVVRKAEGRA